MCVCTVHVCLIHIRFMFMYARSIWHRKFVFAKWNYIGKMDSHIIKEKFKQQQKNVFSHSKLNLKTNQIKREFDFYEENSFLTFLQSSNYSS